MEQEARCIVRLGDDSDTLESHFFNGFDGPLNFKQIMVGDSFSKINREMIFTKPFSIEILWAVALDPGL